MPQEYFIINNEQQRHFEIRENEDIAWLEYRFYKKDIAFMHTEVPDRMSGKGVASALAEYAFKYAKEIKKPVMVYCPFVAAYLKRHPELKQQLDKEYL
ncbi:MAG: N-acetyltransferase [Bacteroidota bacterium]|nr:N-acetyltransferase [Bacteroidota bacterium]MDQ6890461.1 N-acetyltransferase [Bacteroidota bacterium]